MQLATYIHRESGVKVQIEPDNADHLHRMEISGFVPFIQDEVRRQPKDGSRQTRDDDSAILELLDSDDIRTHENTPTEEYYPAIVCLPEPSPIVIDIPPITPNSLAPYPDELFTWDNLKKTDITQLRRIAKTMKIKTPQPAHKDAYVRAILDKYEGR